MLQIALIWPWAPEVSDSRESQQRLCFISLGSHKNLLIFEKRRSETGTGFRLAAKGKRRGPPGIGQRPHRAQKKSSGLAVSHVSIFLLSGSRPKRRRRRRERQSHGRTSAPQTQPRLEGLQTSLREARILSDPRGLICSPD